MRVLSAKNPDRGPVVEVGWCESHGMRENVDVCPDNDDMPPDSDLVRSQAIHKLFKLFSSIMYFYQLLYKF